MKPPDDAMRGPQSLPAPSPQPEMPDPELCVRIEPVAYVPLRRLRAVLAVQGYDVVTAKQKAVLDAWELLSEDARESAMTELDRRRK